MKEKAYRNYVTDALKYISENTAKRVGGQYMKVHYSDSIKPKKKKKKDTRTGEEIAADIIKKIARKGDTE